MALAFPFRQIIPWPTRPADSPAQATAQAIPAWQPDFEALVNTHQSMVFSLALRMTGDPGLAEEIAQDVLLELDRHLDRILSPDHARFWLRQVTVHRSADALRRRNTRQPGWNAGLWVELEEHHAQIDPDPTQNPDGFSPELESLLAGLPSAHRAALLLRYQEDLTPEEIARTLNTPVATVKSHLQRGLKSLRLLLAAPAKETSHGQ